MSGKQASFFYRNSLSIVLIVMMLFFWTGQFLAGWKDHNDTLQEYGQPALTAAAYAQSGHFISATFENWESEFLQMAIYVILTISLRQKGSAESKKLKGEPGADTQEVDRPPQPHKDAPWPVRKGGIWLAAYKHSLSAAFILLFLLSFWLHFLGSLRDYNNEQQLKGAPTFTTRSYFSHARFWFESFQNWQSEFLAVGAIVLLSIWLRQKGSPESKPVDAPHDETGT